jgi:hypothetical protein
VCDELLELRRIDVKIVEWIKRNQAGRGYNFRAKRTDISRTTFQKLVGFLVVLLYSGTDLGRIRTRTYGNVAVENVHLIAYTNYFHSIPK